MSGKKQSSQLSKPVPTETVRDFVRIEGIADSAETRCAVAPFPPPARAWSCDKVICLEFDESEFAAREAHAVDGLSMRFVLHLCSGPPLNLASLAYQSARQHRSIAPSKR